jgi:hypothetical protein
MAMKIYSQNDQTLTLPNLTDVVNGVITPIPGATVSFSLFDANNVAVLSNVTMNYVPGTASDYAGAILYSFNPDLTAHPNTYTLQITATYSGKTANWFRSGITIAPRTI